MGDMSAARLPVQIGRAGSRPRTSVRGGRIADAGVDTALPAAVVDLFRRGMDAGHAADSFSSLVELMTKAGA